MPTGQLTPVLRYLRRVQDADSDAELLERFAARRDEAAFTALVRRHGPMVLGVCRRVLGNVHDADDAFQATFLLLLRRAGLIRRRESVGPWLHGVALRTASKAKALAARRRGREQPVEDVPAPSADDLLWRDLRPVLDDAIARLPAKYRAPFVLCYLEGLTNAQAARRLGCAPGTVATWLARARRQLRRSLAGRGLALPAAIGGAVAVPSALLAGVIEAALTPTAAPASVVALMKGVGRAMLMQKLRIGFAAFALLGAAGVGVLTYGAAAGGPGSPQEAPPAAGSFPIPAVTTIPPPAQDAQQTFTARSKNFVIEAPSRHIAQLVADTAERERKKVALLWLSKELPAWQVPCPVRLELGPAGSGGHSTFSFEGDKVRSRSMHLSGQLDRVLDSALPHEVTHLVLADHFGRPIPRWADEGAAVQAEEAKERQNYTRLAREVLDKDRLIALRRLLPMREYPGDVMAFFAESYSLAHFLVERKDRRTFLEFVKLGATGAWDEAAERYYGFRDVDALETTWIAHVRKEGELAKVLAEGSGRRPAGPGPTPKKAAADDEKPLAVGPAPITALAVLDEQGGVRLRMPVNVYQPVSSYVRRDPDGPAEPVTSYRIVQTSQQVLLNAGSFRAFGPDGKPIKAADLARLLKMETAVLYSANGEPVDPFYLHTVKEGTIILIGPPAAPEATPPLTAEPVPARPPWR